MTIEEFRNFGWKAGMEVKFMEEDTTSYDIVGVDFNHNCAWTGGFDEDSMDIFYPGLIGSILNPDGTVAWRAK